MIINGTEEWTENNKRHRLDGPAIIYADGSQRWFVNGKLHRLDGPAVIVPANGTQEWWVEGNKITEYILDKIKEMGIRTDWENWTKEEKAIVRLYL